MHAREAGASVEEHDFREFVFPPYDADVHAAEGIPPAVTRFGDIVSAADGVLLASPEYNFSMPGTLKNSIDWLSRIRPFPIQGRWALLLSASNSRVGGNRGLWHLRVPLEAMGMMVYPEMFSLPLAGEAFGDDGQLQDAALEGRLASLAGGFVAMVRRARS
jgi:NAD(P)H-dependent FMN reductase